jgi:SRSO17 transposase
MVSIVVF